MFSFEDEDGAGEGLRRLMALPQHIPWVSCAGLGEAFLVSTWDVDQKLLQNFVLTQKTTKILKNPTTLRSHEEQTTFFYITVGLQLCASCFIKLDCSREG